MNPIFVLHKISLKCLEFGFICKHIQTTIILLRKVAHYKWPKLSAIINIVIAYSQLFGEADPDEDVSPDSADPELVGQAGQSALDNSTAAGQSGAGTSQDSQSASNGNVLRVSTRAWAVSHDYCPKVIIEVFLWSLFVTSVAVSSNGLLELLGWCTGLLGVSEGHYLPLIQYYQPNTHGFYISYCSQIKIVCIQNNHESARIVLF